MCIVCELKKAAGKVFGVELKEEVIGKVNAGTILKLQLAEQELDKVKELSEAELKLLHLEGKTKEEVVDHLTAKYADRFNKAGEELNQAYDELLQPFNLDRETADDKGYKVDIKRGLLIREYFEEKKDTPQGVH